MHLLQIVVLAIVQGAAELLPVSSSAHVIVAEKLMGLDPTAPQMTLLLVMLHTGTMFAVIVYFWRSWRDTFFASRLAFRDVDVEKRPRRQWLAQHRLSQRRRGFRRVREVVVAPRLPE